MTEPDEDSIDIWRLLSRLAGRVDAEALLACRSAAARESSADLALLLAQLTVGDRVPLLPDENEALAGWLADSPLELMGALPEPTTTQAVALRLFPDETGPTSRAAAVVGCLEGVEGVVGVWCAEARAAWGSVWPPPRPFVVVEVADERFRAAVEHLVLPTLEDPAVGGLLPHFAVITGIGAETPLVGEAQRVGTLAWAARPDPGIRFAALFPSDPPAAEPDDGSELWESAHDLTTTEWEHLVHYLGAGEVVLWSDRPGDDVITGEPEVVPMELRSDGRWVWCDAGCYYLFEYGVPLDEALVAHVLAQDADPSPLDGLDVHRVLDLLSDGSSGADTDGADVTSPS